MKQNMAVKIAAMQQTLSGLRRQTDQFAKDLSALKAAANGTAPASNLSVAMAAEVARTAPAAAMKDRLNRKYAGRGV